MSNHLAQRVVMWMGDERSVRSIVIGLLMNTMIYCFSQEKATKKPDASSEPPGTTAQPEAGPRNAPDETKPEPSGAQLDVQVRAHFVREAKVDDHCCSKHPVGE